jgi:hypothetical protein
LKEACTSLRRKLLPYSIIEFCVAMKIFVPIEIMKFRSGKFLFDASPFQNGLKIKKKDDCFSAFLSNLILEYVVRKVQERERGKTGIEWKTLGYFLC